MIRTLLISLAACTIAVPPIATAESNAPEATRESVRFTAAAANTSHAGHVTDGASNPSRGSGQRAYLRLLKTAYSSNTSARFFETMSESGRFTATTAVRKTHANEMKVSVEQDVRMKTVSNENDNSKRGSGQRALSRSLENLTATTNSVNTSAQSLGAARESVRYSADAMIRENYTLALFPGNTKLPESSEESSRGSSQRAHSRSLRINGEAD